MTDEEKQVAALKRYQAMNKDQMEEWHRQLKAWAKDPKNNKMPEDMPYLVSFDTPMHVAIKDEAEKAKLKEEIRKWQNDPQYVLAKPLDVTIDIPNELRKALLALLRGSINSASIAMSILLRNHSEQTIRGAIFDAFPHPSWSNNEGPAIGPAEETPVPAGSDAAAEEDVLPIEKEKG